MSKGLIIGLTVVNLLATGVSCYAAYRATTQYRVAAEVIGGLGSKILDNVSRLERRNIQ